MRKSSIGISHIELLNNQTYSYLEFYLYKARNFSRNVVGLQILPLYAFLSWSLYLWNSQLKCKTTLNTELWLGVNIFRIIMHGHLFDNMHQIGKVSVFGSAKYRAKKASPFSVDFHLK